MKKLKNKTFILLLSILTIFLLTLIIIFNSFIYQTTYKDVQNKLKRVENIQDRFNPFNDNNNNPMFMDMDVYVVLFDNRFNIKRVVNYASDGKTENEIVSLIRDNKIKYMTNDIDNLYTNKYIYYMNHRNELMIINNSSINARLITILYSSIILFIILEVVIVYVSGLLTKWLVKPVKESFDRQRQFISDASHELKTPLSVIMASAETLESDPTNTKWITNIKDESERMNKLVIDLLNLAKSENIEENLIFEEINISKVIEMTTLKFESLCFENNLKIDYDIEENIKYKCQPDKIKELLGILIDNAIKHGIEDSKIKVCLNKEKDNIVLKVKNRGEVIPKEDRELIFERFYRSDKSRNRSENRFGLGLAIAKNIVESHKGTIKVECQNGYTTFTVNFK